MKFLDSFSALHDVNSYINVKSVSWTATILLIYTCENAFSGIPSVYLVDGKNCSLINTQ